MRIKRVEHIAIAVNDLGEHGRNLEHIFGLQKDYDEQIGETKLAMYPIGETSIELLQAVGPSSKVGDWVRERGESLFHLCFEVDDIDGALDELKAKGVKLIDETPRNGHGGSRIAFIDPAATGGILIELAELPDGGH
jgi:methylmalonyl-CoA epimerase